MKERVLSLSLVYRGEIMNLQSSRRPTLHTTKRVCHDRLLSFFLSLCLPSFGVCVSSCREKKNIRDENTNPFGTAAYT